MRAALLVSGLVLLLAALSYYVVRHVHAQTPDASVPAPSDLTRRAQAADQRRMAAVLPPASRVQRFRNRVKVCSRRGHTYRMAFAPRYAHQCVDCGHVRAIDTLDQVRA